MSGMIYFNKSLEKLSEDEKSKLGIRGRRVIDLAEMGLPIAPGFIIDSETTKNLPDMNIKEELKEMISLLEKEMKKTFGDSKKPLLLKIVLSSDLNVPFFPSIHNVGLTMETVEGFSKMTSDDFAYGEFAYMLRGIGTKLYGVSEDSFSSMKLLKGKKFSPSEMKKCINDDFKLIEEDLSGDVYDQLVAVLKKAASVYCDSDIDVDNSMSIMVQAMVFGNMGDQSFSGSYYTRNIVTGKDELQGTFLQNAFDIDSAGSKKDILKIEKKYLDKLESVAKKVEENFRELRNIKFTIEQGNLWLVEQREVDDKSTQSHLMTLLALHERKVIDSKFLVKTMKPVQLNELLHPVIDPTTIKTMKKIQGGISGSTGAAIGRVFFSTAKILEEYKRAIMGGKDKNLILVMTATYAEDVKAIEVAQGVVSSEGGYSSHAPVVARSLGKVAMVMPEIKIRGNAFTIGGVTVKEGDYISLNVPYYEAPTVYFGKAGLIQPNFKENGLLEFSNIAQKYIGEFDVRANADQPKDAEVAKLFSARGIGLCRTEHMFFNEKRIMRFREMILAEDEKARRKALDELRPMQRSDFYELFKIMQGNPVTIRLLDAPLHEFLPRTEDTMQEFVSYMISRNKSMKAAEIKLRCEDLSEMNPMLGHRGCRVAITYPEIYEMQCRAIFEAACMLKKEGVVVKPEIMIPIVMSEQELKFIKNGKKIEGRSVKGIRDIKDEVVEEYGAGDIEYSVGSMIELPAAALRAGQIAQFAEFFSFGTNDLTQTTYGLSRDDVNSFFPSYTLYDLFKTNPFQVLGDEVKELVGTAALRGRMTRPNLKLGLCGEHGADPENIAFCINAGLNYVSTSPYAIPLAKLAIAHYNIEKEEKEKV